jgi:hypothetical protein
MKSFVLLMHEKTRRSALGKIRPTSKNLNGVLSGHDDSMTELISVGLTAQGA